MTSKRLSLIFLSVALTLWLLDGVLWPRDSPGRWAEWIAVGVARAFSLWSTYTERWRSLSPQAVVRRSVLGAVAIGIALVLFGFTFGYVTNAGALRDMAWIAGVALMIVALALLVYRR